MPRNDLTDLVFVLDRSGSMAARAEDVRMGFNSLIEKQRKGPGAARVTLWLFDDRHDVIYRRAPLTEIEPLAPTLYYARGSTALCDAICKCIDDEGSRLAALHENERPGKVILTIMTDGLENASHAFDANDVHKRVAHQRDKYGWEILFIGANQDAIKTGEKYGIGRAHAMSFSANAAAPVAAAFAGVANYAIRSRQGGPGGQSLFTDEERAASMKDDKE